MAVEYNISIPSLIPAFPILNSALLQQESYSYIHMLNHSM